MTDNNAWGRPERSPADPASPDDTQAWGTPAASATSAASSDSLASPASPSSAEQDTNSQQTGKGKRFALIAVAILAVLALISAGVWALVNKQEPADKQSASPAAPSTSTEDSASSKEAATPENSHDEATEDASAEEPDKYDKCNDYADDKLSVFRAPVKMYCDDSWLFAGEDGTSEQVLFYWTDNAWHRYTTDGEAWPSHMGCYDRDKLKDAGAPIPLLDTVTLCTDEDNTEAEAAEDEEDPAADEFAWAGDWNGKCDGRYILIVESALIDGPEPYTETSRIQDKYPGSQILRGSACSSLRATVDGKSVYAIYYDAGYSVDKVCSLKAQYGGNARSLNDNADFTDPC